MNTNKNRISMRVARILAGMTEQEACTAMKIKLHQLRAWENGNRIPSHEHAITMADAYGLPLDLISFSKEDNKSYNRPTSIGCGSLAAICKAAGTTADEVFFS